MTKFSDLDKTNYNFIMIYSIVTLKIYAFICLFVYVGYNIDM